MKLSCLVFALFGFRAAVAYESYWLAEEAAADADIWGVAVQTVSAPAPVADLSESENWACDFGPKRGAAHAFYDEMRGARKRAVEAGFAERPMYQNGTSAPATSSPAAYAFSDVSVSVPEPAGGLMVVLGLAALGLRRRRV